MRLLGEKIWWGLSARWSALTDSQKMSYMDLVPILDCGILRINSDTNTVKITANYYNLRQKLDGTMEHRESFQTSTFTREKHLEPYFRWELLFSRREIYSFGMQAKRHFCCAVFAPKRDWKAQKVTSQNGTGGATGILLNGQWIDLWQCQVYKPAKSYSSCIQHDIFWGDEKSHWCFRLNNSLSSFWSWAGCARGAKQYLNT